MDLPFDFACFGRSAQGGGMKGIAILPKSIGRVATLVLNTITFRVFLDKKKIACLKSRRDAMIVTSRRVWKDNPEGMA
ncbi:MAG: hypothetical protein A3K45_06015 [Chloroflexi bacterium RIFOXYC12_FULL_59_14]|nr:MAG: hypothetical protein A3K45_06015 [Chloroflexi bacterium RIFOXYC12_FULL_59_14]